MTYPTTYTATDELADDVEDLRRRVDELDTVVSQEHAERLYQLENDDRLEDLRSQVEQLDERADKHDDQATALRAGLQRLTGQLLWLEHHVRAERDLKPIDLDQVPATWAELARQIQIGETARASLLTERRRDYLRADIDRHNAVMAQAQLQQTKTLQHSKTIATSTPGSAAHNTAAAEFHAARTQLDNLHQRAKLLQPDALNASAQLKADDKLRAKVGPQIMRAERARPQLLAKLRTRIGQAVRRHDLFPGWFTTVFGYQPPAGHAETWAHLAADVLAHRLTWNITDQVTALGDTPPRNAAHKARYAERQTLATRLADLFT